MFSFNVAECTKPQFYSNDCVTNVFPYISGVGERVCTTSPQLLGRNILHIIGCIYKVIGI